MANNSKASKVENLVSAAFDADSIKNMAETIGLNTLPDDAAKKLGEDVTDKVKTIIRDALKFMNHSKRNCLTTDDIDRAIKLQNIEPQYGFQAADFEPFRFAAGGGRELHFIEEKETNLSSVIAETPPKIPLKVRLRTHWLAVDGQQPAIPENPAPLSVAQQAAGICKPMVKLNLNTSSSSSSTNARKLAQPLKCKKHTKLRSSEMVNVRQLAMHEISVEKQLYFKEITDACISTNGNRRSQAWNSLENDPGLYEICPRLCMFISEGVKVNVAKQNFGLLIDLMRMARAIIDNPTLYIEKYLHELVPAAITCVVSKTLSTNSLEDSHWKLRTYAAKLIADICKVYNNSTNNLQTRVTRIYSNGLENTKIYLTTIYGAIVGLCALGTDVINVFILPNLKIISQRIETKLFGAVQDPVDKLTTDQIRNMVSTYCTPILVQTRNPPDLVEDYRNDYGTVFATSLCFSVLQARGNTNILSSPTFVFDEPARISLPTVSIPISTPARISVVPMVSKPTTVKSTRSVLKRNIQSVQQQQRQSNVRLVQPQVFKLEPIEEVIVIDDV